MLASVSDVWVCPRDGAGLRFDPESGLRCSRCRAGFPLEAGIARFAGPPAGELQSRERHHRDRWVASALNARERYEARTEAEAVWRRLRLAPGDRALDAGCGIGHITRGLLASGAHVLAVDFSWPRLLHLRQIEPSPRLEVALADLTQLPIAPASLDCIVSTQVIEHLPTAALRRQLLASFFRCLRPGGRLVLTAYNLSEPWRRRGQAPEGLHETGIFYHCYTAAELERELDIFRVTELCGIVQLLPHTYRLFPRLGPLARRLDHVLEARVGLSRKWGHLLLAQAVRP